MAADFRSLLFVGFDNSVADRNNSFGAFGDFVFVRDNNNRVAFFPESFKQSHNFDARFRIERAGRFVGK